MPDRTIEYRIEYTDRRAYQLWAFDITNRKQLLILEDNHEEIIYFLMPDTCVRQCNILGGRYEITEEALTK